MAHGEPITSVNWNFPTTSSVSGYACTSCGIFVYHGTAHVCWSAGLSATPHKCPCCDGWGKRDAVRSADSVTQRLEDCPSCSGSGVIWR
jgi:DnaJ-class molecular chaperone